VIESAMRFVPNFVPNSAALSLKNFVDDSHGAEMVELEFYLSMTLLAGKSLWMSYHLSGHLVLLLGALPPTSAFF
jgi:hypothetical protein